jgi:nucleoside-diphosphate-sugar epimerase
MKRALVTGHAGFIGRHMWKRLVAEGYQVTGVDIAEDDQYDFMSLQQDVRDFFRWNGKQYDLVVHCAAVVGGRMKIDGAPLEVAVDLAIDAELFQWALRTQPGAIVYFSSSAAYPTWLQQDDGILLHEDIIDLNGGLLGNPDQTYGWSKLTGELLARRYAELGGAVHVFRPFSGYGTDQDLNYPFPAFIDRAKRELDPFEVWGDGKQVRDFIHVNDIVEAVVTAVDNRIYGPVNLCTGIATSFNDLAHMVTKLAGYDATIVHRNNAPTGVRYRVGDPAEMLKFYKPKIDLAEGIDLALCGIV